MEFLPKPARENSLGRCFGEHKLVNQSLAVRNKREVMANREQES